MATPDANTDSNTKLRVYFSQNSTFSRRVNMLRHAGLNCNWYKRGFHVSGNEASPHEPPSSYTKLRKTKAAAFFIASKIVDAPFFQPDSRATRQPSARTEGSLLKGVLPATFSHHKGLAFHNSKKISHYREATGNAYNRAHILKLRGHVAKNSMFS
jgi:hypothetical protein